MHDRSGLNLAVAPECHPADADRVDSHVLLGTSRFKPADLDWYVDRMPDELPGLHCVTVRNIEHLCQYNQKPAGGRIFPDAG
jgi:hypothetical protein